MLRSHPSSVFVLKYWMPILFFASTSVFWSVGFRWPQLFILVPLFLGCLFFASLAILKVPDGNIRYRRLFKWNKVLPDEVVGCGVVGGGIGYLRLSRFVFPWGRLYFVLDFGEGTISHGEYALLRFAQRRMGKSFKD